MADFGFARKSFDENRNMFASAGSGASPAQMEKYNLYNGLASLAQALSNLEQRILRIEHASNRLSR